MGHLPSAQRPALSAGTLSGAGPAPIAQVTGASAAAAAFEEVSAALQSARAEGRLVQALPLSAVDESYLVRDRLGNGQEDLQSLTDSLRARGQQTPIEVVALTDDRFGLISGWRRLMALRALHAETGEARFGTVLALLRQPATASDAYVAMVEENEIRLGLSYYERARIVARAAEMAVFSDEASALKALFAAASRAKRSKIGSFLAVYHALDARLRFAGAIPERLGLALARAMQADAVFAPRLADRLRKAGADTPEAELAVLHRALADAGAEGGAGRAEAGEPGTVTGRKAQDGARGGAGAPADPMPAPGRPAGPSATLDRPDGAEEIAYGIWLQQGGGALRPQLILSGPRVDAGLRDRLTAWLRQQG